MASPTSAGSPPAPSPGSRRRDAGRWLPLLALLAGVVLVDYAATRKARAPREVPISYSDFYQDASDGKVASVVFTGRAVTGHFATAQKIQGRQAADFRTTLPDSEDPSLLPLLRGKKVDITAAQEGSSPVTQLLVAVLPWLIIVGAWVWLSKRAQKLMSSGGPLAGLVRGKAKRFERESRVLVRFSDVAGLTAAKRDLNEVVEFLRSPDRFRRLGGHIPRGVLLVGPPGTGKTLLARAVAGEAEVPFFSVNGSEFIELFVGMGAARVRELFDEAKKVAPAIVFIDEIDAVGRSRGAGLGVGNDEREQTLNQLLSTMDGFSRNDMVIVLGATNRPDVLDPALLRPGRFDRRVLVDRPELAARVAILQVHSRGKPIGGEVDWRQIAARTPGFSGADLENLVNEAALNATRRQADAIGAVDFDSAYDKVVLGDPRETVLSADEKRRVAVHESGHAVVAYFTEGVDRIDRVSILPRGMTLGATHQVPAGDRHMMTRGEIAARLRVLMGGLAAETTVLGEPSSGAEHDLKAATALAFDMVGHYGMSDTFGPVYLEHRTEQALLGQTIAVEGATSDATIHRMEAEVQRVLEQSVDVAGEMIRAHRPAFDRLVTALLEQETIEREALERVLGAGPRAATAA